MKKNPDTENSCNLAIKKTLAYRSVFKYPLSAFQLKTCLITNKEFKNKVLNENIEKSLRKGFIKKKDNRYFLPGINPVNWEERLKNTKLLLEKNKKFFKLLKNIPWIRLISVTGSVAAYNTSKESDIDILIVTSKNRVWLTRGFVTLLLKLMKKFPKKDGEEGKFCTNLYMDEKNLRWPKNKRNIHIAHDIILMQPMVDKDETYLKFLRANKWVTKYFAHFYINYPESSKKTKIYRSFLINFLEYLSRVLQLRYMKNKKTSEITLKHFIHFKKHDNTRRIIDQFNNILNNRKIS